MTITRITDIKLYEAQRDGGEPFHERASKVKLYPHQDVIDKDFGEKLIAYIEANAPNMFEAIVGTYTSINKLGFAFRSHTARTKFQTYMNDVRPQILQEAEAEGGDQAQG